MSNELLTQCPICHETLTVTQLHCNHCFIEISGEFKLSRLSQLSKDQLAFVEVFLKNRGNIKDCEKDLGVSYPTIRRILNEILDSLGYSSSSEEEPSTNQKEIIKRLENGEITVKEATELLKGK